MCGRKSVEYRFEFWGAAMNDDESLKTSEEIEMWETKLGSLRMEWEGVVQNQRSKRWQKRGQLVEGWEQSFREVADEFSDLVRRGRWQRGPSDVFSILGRERRETYHSAMLAWLLDPLAPHGLGDAFLQAFLGICDSEWRLDNAYSGIVEVACEVAGRDCRADIVIRTKDFVVVVENKLDAVEGVGQCDRLYRDFYDGEKDVRFVFLSPSGRVPHTATGEAADAFRAVGYRDVRLALARVLGDVSDAKPSTGRQSALNYLSTLDKEFP